LNTQELEFLKNASSSMIKKEVQFACRIERAEKCIKQSAPIAAKNVKFRSNPILPDQFTAEIVGQREDSREDGDSFVRLLSPLLAQRDLFRRIPLHIRTDF